MTKPRNNEDGGLIADFVFKDSNLNVGKAENIITFSTPVDIIPIKNERRFQENKFMEKIIEPLTDVAPTKIISPDEDSYEEKRIPKSCFKTFAHGVVNNLKEMAKCFGLK